MPSDGRDTGGHDSGGPEVHRPALHDNHSHIVADDNVSQPARAAWPSVESTTARTADIHAAGDLYAGTFEYERATGLCETCHGFEVAPYLVGSAIRLDVTRAMQPSIASHLTLTSRDDRRRGWAVVATVATLSIVGSLTTATPAANAAEKSIAVSVQDGSFLQDVVDGRITVDQLVDASIAGRAQGSPALDRGTLTQGMTAEVEQLRSTGSTPAWGQLGSDTDQGQPEILQSAATPAPDPEVGTQLSFWRKFKHFFHHWGTVRITAPVGDALLGGGTAAGIAALVAGAFGFIASAIFTSIGAAAFIALGAVALSCEPRHLKFLYIKFPDLGNSHCGN
ncbi:hypothetical protein ACR8AL_09180 [Clavibacter sepedonicus]|uniref:Membrane protein n=1 Tax=Clavibacter sepedonicus TaxID=31964 RepID=B0RJ30_CLASE|nr:MULTISPECIES: hypothetical protein [Clavibacter]MBD5382709.1 hypothetical protein [Clavibacter sp.]OQJ45080.1 hypothetical protein B5P19_15950 [Clavibacter sepedonicus]OQJ50897.1 hypothetical protein B5P20_15800 [Clavibacter sepedonicus]UUK67306.1 hypothetical protein LRE50_16230 [Clavibacter sepedonicus]CAQ03219.1 putative membrane protein [Clavibacter sepedonicus]